MQSKRTIVIERTPLTVFIFGLVEGLDKDIKLTL